MFNNLERTFITDILSGDNGILNNILRDSDDCMPMNKLVSECLFLDHVTKNNRNPSLNSKWANASKKPTDIDIGKHTVPTKCYR